MNFSDLRMLVIGDAMLDVYQHGRITHIAPEAPVPVFKLDQTTYSAGGAANVAANLVALGCKTALVAVTGNDPNGSILANKFYDAGIVNLCPKSEACTTTKTRTIIGNQHLMRVDHENSFPLEHETLSRIQMAIDTAMLTKPDAIILSDYGKGVLPHCICTSVIEQAREVGIPVFVDPKGASFEKYRSATCVTPNLDELALVTTLDKNDLVGMKAHGAGVAAALDIDNILLTQGADGMTVIDPTGVSLSSAAQGQEVFDVTGAGDTVIATIAAARTSGMEWPEAMALANKAAGAVVAHIGAVPVTLADINGIEDKHLPVYPFGEILQLAERWRAKGETIVFTNGCFDLFHMGHVAVLEHAAEQGDRVIVGMNSDEGVKRLKGHHRPVQGFIDRVSVLASIGCVDAVFVFDDHNPFKFICELQPDVLVKGSEYRNRDIAGAQAVEKAGGRVSLAPHVGGRSTTDIIRRIKESVI